MDGAVSSNDADILLYGGYHSDTHNTTGNATFYKDPKIDQLIDQARREYDPAKRKALYVELQRYLYDLSLWVYVNYVDVLMAGHKNVKNIQFGSFFHLRPLEETWIAS
jgi:peptide/nickel transport system substrate-binding protein